MNPNSTVEECLQILDDIDGIIKMLNTSIQNYNTKRDELNEHLTHDIETKNNVDMMLVKNLRIIAINDIHNVNEESEACEENEEYEIIEDDNITFDKYDDIGDFEMNNGSKSRCLKGTGKNKNTDNIYNTKHVRVSLAKSKK